MALDQGPLQALEAQREAEHAAPLPSALRPPLSPQRAPVPAGFVQGSAAPPPPAAGTDKSTEEGLLDPNPEGLGVKRDGSTSPPADPSVVLARSAAAAEGFGLALGAGGEPPSGDGITAEQRVAAAGFCAVPPSADGGVVRSASTAVTVGHEEVAEEERLLRSSAAEADAEAERGAKLLERRRALGGGASNASLAQWSSGSFMAESSANWVIDFNELVRVLWAGLQQGESPSWAKLQAGCHEVAKPGKRSHRTHASWPLFQYRTMHLSAETGPVKASAQY